MNITSVPDNLQKIFDRYIGEKMKLLTQAQLRELEWELYRATVSGICQWQLLTPECASSAVGEYGIFLAKDDKLTRLSVYHDNLGCVAELKVHNFNILLGKAMKQAELKNKMNVQDLQRHDADMRKINDQRINLGKRVRRILNRP